jgi:aspartyl-tRNA(Asn)/glutamyl-tRNA(Gln) amidotransferase subunit B
LRSPEEAAAYFAALRQILMYLGVNDGNLQEGSMRADVNVSVRRPGEPMGTKVEIKNLNSFRAVQRALRFEIDRQAERLARGEVVEHETRGWSEDAQVTLPQRTKEYAHDYRYFPEPDLPALVFTRPELDVIQRSMPELPDARKHRFQSEYELSPATAEVLTSERDRADFFEETARAAAPVKPPVTANWVSGEVFRLLNETGIPVPESSLRPEELAHLLKMVDRGEVSGTAAKTALEEIFRTGDGADEVVQRLGLQRIGDADAIEALADEVIAANPSMVQQFRAGKVQVLQALIGKAMGASKGKADPALVRDALQRKLGPPPEQ